MDDQTAISFAIECFQKLHSRESSPEWLSRCSAICYNFDEQRHYLISFTVTPLVTNAAVVYFQVKVDPHTGSTMVLLDKDLKDWKGEELQGFCRPTID